VWYPSRVSRAGIVVIGIALVACGEPQRELREWQPSDHQQPSAGAPSDGRTAPPEARDPDPEATERRAAAALFQAMCGSCHGREGRGDGAGRPPAAPVSDLTSAAWQESRTDEEIAEAITLGRGGFMPAFGEQLSAPGIAALVRHVRRLGGRGGETEGGAEAEDGDGTGAETETETETGAETGAGAGTPPEASGEGGAAAP
jgi:mono/diheme cytochrome c family protein